LFALFRRMRAEGLNHMGIYHSHPRGDNAPSPSDIEQAFYPDAMYFIVSPQANAARPVRAFRIADGEAREMTIQAA
jgi:[CysO sulfur-carrier protein]-S-L-cysteine hydrolase